MKSGGVCVTVACTGGMHSTAIASARAYKCDVGEEVTVDCISASHQPPLGNRLGTPHLNLNEVPHWFHFCRCHYEMGIDNSKDRV